MDPTISLPLHFTIETAVLVAAGLVLAWAMVERRFVPAAAAGIFGVVQGLHAGQFVAAEDAPVFVVLRLGALLVLAIVLRAEVRRRWFGAGLTFLGLGAIAGAIAGGDAASMSLPAHLLLLIGTIPLFVWSWRSTRGSVRLRVLFAFLSVLAVAVVVAGGAVARVASVNSRAEEQSRLARQVTDLANHVVEREAFLAARAADSSPAVTIALRDSRAATSNVRAQDSEWLMVIAPRTGRALGTLRGENAATPPSPEELASFDAVSAALGGDPGSQATLTSDGLLTIGAAPVFRAGSAQQPSDVAAAVVVGTARSVDGLLAVVADDETELVLRDGSSAISSAAPSAINGFHDIDPGASTVEAGGDRWYASGLRLPRSGLEMVLLAPTGAIAGPALDLVRAFLLAILAAALLAVVAALWLSSRITRPLLDLADEAERVKTDFLASVSHELRTPLTPIRGYTEILKMSGPEGEASEYLDEIGIATQRLERIVALLVDVAAIEAGRYLIDPQEVSVKELFDEALSRWAGRSRRHTLDVTAPKSLPLIRADAHAIGRVLDELIDNAIKFSPEGGVVELRATRAGSTVDVSVSDHGKGMDEAQLAQAKAAFQTKESGDARQFGGLGLGLAFVEGVLRGHDARLDITSTVDEGTSCRFSLPVAGSVTGMQRKASRRGA